jgi:flagellar basal-body rod modification protein FlgD
MAPRAAQTARTKENQSMDISSISQPRGTANQAAASAQNELGKDDFLKLLTVQLRYQDPLNPLENTEFIAQMAQFTSLEQLQNMSSALERSADSQTRLHDMAEDNLATSLIGRSIEVPTSEISFDGASATTMSYQVPAGAVAAQARIVDATGRLVQQIELEGPQPVGSFSWDGTSAAGDQVPAGAYLVAIQAQDYSGASLGGDCLRNVRVQGVRYTASGAVVWGDGVELSLEQLRGVIESQP